MQLTAEQDPLLEEARANSQHEQLRVVPCRRFCLALRPSSNPSALVLGSAAGSCARARGIVLTPCPLLLQVSDRRAWELPPLALWEALANPMHPDNKLPSHGKAGSSGAPAQHHNVSQAPTCNLGSKGVGAGSHGSKATQISPGNSGLKNSQNTVPNFSSLKGKVKRERSISVDSGEQREASTPSQDAESKGNTLLNLASARPPRSCSKHPGRTWDGSSCEHLGFLCCGFCLGLSWLPVCLCITACHIRGFETGVDEHCLYISSPNLCAALRIWDSGFHRLVRPAKQEYGSLKLHQTALLCNMQTFNLGPS